MSPVCKDVVLQEVSDDVDAQEKTDGVLVGVFSRGYEMGRVVSDVGAEVVSDLEFEAGVLAGDGQARKRKREDDLGECPVNRRVRKEMDLPGFATRGPRAKMQKRKRRGPVKFPGFERPEELTWEHIVAAGGVPVRVGGAGGIGGAAVEASTMGGRGEVKDRAPAGVRSAGGGVSRWMFRISKGRGGEVENLARRGGAGPKCPSLKSGPGGRGGSGRREFRSGKGWPNGRGFPKREIGDGHADNLVEYMFRRTGTRFRVPEPAPTVSSCLLVDCLKLSDSNIMR